MLGDLLVFREQIEQRTFLPNRLAADLVDEVVRVIATEVGTETHHHRLRNDESVRHVEHFAHSLRVDLQPAQNKPCLLERTGREAKGLRQHDPFDFPRTRRTLVIGDHRVEQRGRVLPNHRDRRMDVARGDRIALLRHRAARAATRGERLVDLADLRLHHQLHVHRELAERSADQAEKAAHFGDRVADCVPCDQRLRKTELLHQRLLRFHRALFDRG